MSGGLSLNTQHSGDIDITSASPVAPPLVGGGPTKATNEQSLLKRSGLNEDEELRVALRESLANSGTESETVSKDWFGGGDGGGDILLRMSASTVSELTHHTLTQSGHFQSHTLSNRQSGNQCAPIATVTAAQYILEGGDVQDSHHPGITLGENIHKEICFSQKMEKNSFTSLQKALDCVSRDLLQDNVMIVEKLNQNIFDQSVRRDLLQQLDNEKQGSIGKLSFSHFHVISKSYTYIYIDISLILLAILFNNHAFNIMKQSNGTFVLLDSLPCGDLGHHVGGFKWICDDIETLDVALLRYASTKLGTDNEMQPFNSENSDCRSFDAILLTKSEGEFEL